MVRIRLQRRGRRKKPFYHIVIADSRAPRDGRFIEKVGTYNPMTKPATIDLDRDLAFEWLLKGAQPSDTVRAILRVKGVMFRKHLHRGVVKGALTQEQADAKYQEYVDKKEAGIADRKAETAREKEELRRKVAGKVPVIATPEPEAPAEEEAAAAPAEGVDVAAPEVTAATEEAVPAEAATSVTEDQSVTQPAPEPVQAEEQTPIGTPEASAPGEEPAEVAEATSPNAVNAAAETDTAEPDHQSAGDKAEDAAEASEEATAEATAEAETEEPKEA